MAVPIVEVLSSAQPEIDTVPESVAPAAGESICTTGGTAVDDGTVIVMECDPLAVALSVSVATAVMVCIPGLTDPAFREYRNPTLGHPGRPGYAAQTSVRELP